MAIATSIRTTTETVMVPTTVTRTTEVASLNLNFRQRKTPTDNGPAFDPARDGQALISLLTALALNTDFTLRLKATAEIENPTAADTKRLKDLNNLLVKLGKRANVTARKDKGEGTPTGDCNNCGNCCKDGGNVAAS